METTTLTTIAAMSEEERAVWAREYAGAGTTTVDDVSAFLEVVRGGDPAPDPKALLALVLDDQQEDELRERALLALYHHIEVVRADDDVESVPAVERMIERLARAPKEEQNEKLRARKSWIKLRHLIDNEAPLEVIVDTVQHLCRDESSAFVLDRVAAAVSGDRATLFALFPSDGTWSPPETDGWNRLERIAIQQTGEAGKILGALRRRVPKVLTAAARGNNDFHRYVETLDAAERGYVVAPHIVAAVLKTLSPLGRNRVLAVCSGGSTREDAPRLSRYLADLLEITAATGNRDWADQFTILAVEATIANVGSELADTRIEDLVKPALELLSQPLPDQYDCSATRHSLSKLTGGILRVVFSDPAQTTAVMNSDGRDAGDQDEIVARLTDALIADSPYIANVAADVALLLARSSALPQELVAPLLARLSQSPATDGGMCSGHDLNDDDIAVPDGVDRVYLSGATEAPDDTASTGAGSTGTDSSGQDGFFSVSGLTGLLEVCREPFCAWRIAAALTTYADTHKDQELTAQLQAYAEENEVIDEWEPRTDDRAATTTPQAKAPPLTDTSSSAGQPMLMSFAAAPVNRLQSTDADDEAGDAGDAAGSDQTGFGTVGKVHPDQPGPYTLREIVETLSHIVDVPRQEWPELQEDIARRREEELQTLVSHSRRNRIKEVFEGLPPGGKTDIGPLVPIATQILQRGFTSFVPLPSFVPGTLDDLDRYDREDPIDPINSTETLAYYVARECLPAARSHQWGIYFRVKPFAALNRAVPGNLKALVEPVAVHELVHHHTAVRSRELRIERTCGTFRVLEEATADWNAVQRLTQMLSDEVITSTRYQEIMRLVFPRREDGGLPGYGDWPLMDSDAAPLAPYFDTSAWDQPRPDGYRTRRQLLASATSPPEITPIQLPREHRLWTSVLEAIGTGEIPMYLDFQ